MRLLGRKAPDRQKPGFNVETEPRLASQLGAAYPNEFDLRELATILDQTNQDCVSNSVCMGYQAAWAGRGVKRALSSRRHNYKHARAYTGDENEDAGTYIHSGLNAAVDFGMPPERVWPYDEDVNKKPSFDAERAAFDWSGPEKYYRIVATGAGLVQAVKQALYVHRAPPIYGTLVSFAFVQGDGTGVIDRPEPDDGIAGGHALGIYGWRTLDTGETLFLHGNSWGPFFGELGFFWTRERFVTWQESEDFNVPRLAD